MEFRDVMALVRAWKDGQKRYGRGKHRAAQSEQFISCGGWRDRRKRRAWLLSIIEQVANVEAVSCEACAGIFDENDMSGAMCEGCAENYSDCHACHEMVSNDDLCSANNGYSYCQGCYDDRFSRCQSCEEECSADDIDEAGHCSDCHEDEDGNGEAKGDGWRVFDSSANTLDILRRDHPQQWLYLPHEAATERTLWLGFELEAQTRRERSDAARNCLNALNGRGILKSDSTIDGSGFELVTLPATLAYHQEAWGGLWDTIRKELDGTSASCGFHVHVNRLALTALQIARLQVFLNDKQNESFVCHVAGRNLRDHTYAAIGEKHFLTDFERPRKRMEFDAKKGCDCDSCKMAREREALYADKVRNQYRGKSGNAMKNGNKYEALNLSNEKTVEFRLFASNVAKVGVLKNLEFVHASLAWAGLCSNLNLTVQSFLAYCQGSRGQYPNLTQWLAKEKHITEKHKRPEFKEMRA